MNSKDNSFVGDAEGIVLTNLKQIAKSIPPIRWLAVALRSQLTQRRPPTTDILQQMVRNASNYVDQPVFVKVGANDGVTGDPFGESLLNNRKWKGVLVEPVPYCIDRLKKIYSDETRFTIVKSAVGSTSGAATFFYVSEAAKDSLPELPDWYDQLGSFDRHHILKHLNGSLEPFIVTASVKVEPLSDILRLHNLSHVTLLHIDTEGFDFEVLKSLGLPALCPSWIMIEHKHLDAEDRSAMLSILQSSEYDVFDTGADFFAMYRKANNGLHRSGRVGRIFGRTGLKPVR